MAMVQFRHSSKQKQVDITRRMGAPRKATMDAWFKQCRKIIPEIPNPKQTDWQIITEDADLRWISFVMTNSVGERCTITIDRTVPAIG